MVRLSTRRGYCTPIAIGALTAHLSERYYNVFCLFISKLGERRIDPHFPVFFSSFPDASITARSSEHHNVTGRQKAVYYNIIGPVTHLMDYLKSFAH